jgi:glyoxalase family protein
MAIAPTGLHHVTAIASDPQRNADFYARTLGLRLIKQTVNFDAPDVYHLYYGDGKGTPGTVMTFFPWPGTPRGRRGTGQATTTSFSVPEGSLGWWQQRLAALGVETPAVEDRGTEEALAFEDPDGLLIELVAHAGTDPDVPWEGSEVPGEHQIRAFHSVTLTESGRAPTSELLTGLLGFELLEERPDRHRYGVDGGGPGKQLDVLFRPEEPPGLVANGTVHHIAWRAPDDPTEERWRAELVDAGVSVTPIIDRQYFHSIYFREPGGVLFEIATDNPGFDTDEPLLELGRKLQLPPWLEPNREQIQAALPKLELPDANEAADRRAEAAARSASAGTGGHETAARSASAASAGTGGTETAEEV